MHTPDSIHSEANPASNGALQAHFPSRPGLEFDAAALALLRKLLVDGVGLVAARAVLTQLGFALGLRAAEAMRPVLERAVAEPSVLRLHSLERLIHLSPQRDDLLSDDGVQLLGSFEATHHLAEFGRGSSPVCWTIAGLLSGYVSEAVGREFLAVEARCVAAGNEECHFSIKTREAWLLERPEAVQVFEKGVTGFSLPPARGPAALSRRGNAVIDASPAELRDDLVTRSEPMKALIALVRQIAPVEATVLITGESGTGKERIARLVHELSARAGGPFVAVNCGAITETLLESELFGHARGAFTGANQERMGLFEAADGGTLLLDEVGEVSPGMQVKLLRVLQEREVRRVGENKSRRVEVRVVAATNRDLAHGVAGGAFRQDLYYRLKVVELRVPPLRERMIDILPLAEVLLQRAARQMKRPVAGFAPPAAELLVGYGWPGNVRELENAMERAAALAAGQLVEVRDLPRELSDPAAKPGGDAAGHDPGSESGVRPLSDVERDYIITALQRNHGNQTNTARQLKIGSATLYRKLRSYGLTTPRLKPGPT